jgi:glycosyltransferase involved in cell wall biosynthesis
VRIAYPFGEHLGYDRARFFQTVRTVSGLARAGCGVAFIVGQAAGLEDRLEKLGLEPDPNLEVIPVTMRQPGPGEKVRWSSNRIFARSALNALVKLDINIVFARHVKLLKYLIKKHVMIPLVYEVHEISWRMAKDQGSPIKRWQEIKDREEKVFGQAAGLVCTSPGLARYLQEEIKPQAEILVAPNPVPDAFFQAPRRSDQASPRVIYVGQFWPWKGVDTLVQAVALTQNARLVLLGGEPGGPDRERLNDLVAELNLKERVEFHGFEPQVKVIDELSRAAVAVVPAPGGDEMSRDFTSPLKLFEYLAAGTPVVATDVPSINQLVKNEGEVLLTPPDDPAAMANRLERILEDQALAERLGQAGRKWARAYTSLERGRKLKEFFQRIMGTRGS